MAQTPPEIEEALGAYALKADAVEALPARSRFVDAFRVAAGERQYVLRVRDPRATEAEVRFAARWARAVVDEVPVPIGLLPVADVPRVRGRCVDICNYIPHEDTLGGHVGPEAWEKLGYWLGCLHRLGTPLAATAPVDLSTGNYASEQRLADFLARARRAGAARYPRELGEADALFQQAEAFLKPRRPGLRSGVVHGDLHFWNVLYTRQQPVAIVDLDSLQRGYLLADVAYASIWLTAWQRDRGGIWQNIQARYLAAYGAGRGEMLSPAESECLPWMGVTYALFFFAQNLLIAGDEETEWRHDLASARDQAEEENRE